MLTRRANRDGCTAVCNKEKGSCLRLVGLQLLRIMTDRKIILSCRICGNSENSKPPLFVASVPFASTWRKLLCAYSVEYREYGTTWMKLLRACMAQYWREILHMALSEQVNRVFLDLVQSAVPRFFNVYSQIGSRSPQQPQTCKSSIHVELVKQLGKIMPTIAK